MGAEGENDGLDELLETIELSDTTAILINDLTDIMEASVCTAEELLLGFSIQLMQCVEGINEAIKEGIRMDSQSLSESMSVMRRTVEIASEMTKNSAN